MEQIPIPFCYTFSVCNFSVPLRLERELSAHSHPHPAPSSKLMKLLFFGWLYNILFQWHSKVYSALPFISSYYLQDFCHYKHICNQHICLLLFSILMLTFLWDIFPAVKSESRVCLFSTLSDFNKLLFENVLKQCTFAAVHVITY